jgi:hypothetical protein
MEIKQDDVGRGFRLDHGKIMEREQPIRAPDDGLFKAGAPKAPRAKLCKIVVIFDM